jgi:hypothetical protein
MTTKNFHSDLKKEDGTVLELPSEAIQWLLDSKFGQVKQFGGLYGIGGDLIAIQNLGPGFLINYLYSPRCVRHGDPRNITHGWTNEDVFRQHLQEALSPTTEEPTPFEPVFHSVR